MTAEHADGQIPSQANIFINKAVGLILKEAERVDKSKSDKASAPMGTLDHVKDLEAAALRRLAKELQNAAVNAITELAQAKNEGPTPQS